jgi:hypothetical protein
LLNSIFLTLKIKNNLEKNMSNFNKIETNNNLSEVIKSAFDTNFKLSGAWGYSKNESTIIEANDNNIPLNQFEHTLASMRTLLEMNIMQKKDNRYGSINLNEISRESLSQNSLIYHSIKYKVTAMKDNDYAIFINEYKEKYGKDDFDLSEHFKRRKEATITRYVTYWFEVSNII